jgi:hypothetical protein
VTNGLAASLPVITPARWIELPIPSSSSLLREERGSERKNPCIIAISPETVQCARSQPRKSTPEARHELRTLYSVAVHTARRPVNARARRLAALPRAAQNRGGLRAQHRHPPRATTRYEFRCSSHQWHHHSRVDISCLGVMFPACVPPLGNGSKFLWRKAAGYPSLSFPQKKTEGRETKFIPPHRQTRCLAVGKSAG